MEDNPIIILAQKSQLLHGKSILTEVVGKTGPDHVPTITAQITLPNGKVFTGIGPNQKEAKKQAAIKALYYYENEYYNQ